MDASVAAASSRPAARLRGFIALTKPRVIELLLVTTVPAMIVAEGGIPSIGLILLTLLGGTLSAGGANAVNMVYDRDIDSVMERTQQRPLVTGLLGPTEALVFALVLEVAAFIVLWRFVNLLSAVLAVGAAAFYIAVYTLWLKRGTSSNVVIGGAAGAAPTLIGFAAVTGSLGWPAVVLFAVVFLWTPPHTWALAMRYVDDYRRADVPMLPAVASFANTTTQMVAYAVLTLIASVIFWPVAETSVFYLIVAVVTGAGFVWGCWQLRVSGSDTGAMKLFVFSINYLLVLFLAVAVDELVFQ